MKHVMKHAVTALLAAAIYVPAQAGIVNNTGSSAEDSLAIAFQPLDSLGNPVGLASGDSIYVVVFYPGGKEAFRDSMAQDNSKISAVAWEDWTEGSLYSYRNSVATIDGSGTDGTYKYILIVDDADLDLRTPYSGEFQLYTTRNLSESFDFIDQSITELIDTPSDSAEIIYVSKFGDDSNGQSWSSAYNSIRKAIDNLSDAHAHIIRVGRGRFFNECCPIKDSNVAIIGAGMNATIVGGHTDSSSIFWLDTLASNIDLAHMTLVYDTTADFGFSGGASTFNGYILTTADSAGYRHGWHFHHLGLEGWSAVPSNAAINIRTRLNDLEIDHCRGWRTRWNSFVSLGNSGSRQVRNVAIHDNDIHGAISEMVYLSNVRHLQIHDNTMATDPIPGGPWWNFDGTDGGADTVVIAGNYFAQDELDSMWHYRPSTVWEMGNQTVSQLENGLGLQWELARLMDTTRVVTDSLDDQSWAQAGSGSGADTSDVRTMMVDLLFADSNIARFSTAAAYMSDVSGCGNGTGAYPCTLFVVSTAGGDTTALQGIFVRAYNANETATMATGVSDSDGRIVFSLDADTYHVYAFQAGWQFAPVPDTVAVSANGTTDSIWAMPFDPGTPANIDLCRVYGWIYGLAGDTLENISVTARLGQIPLRFGSIVISPYTRTTTTDTTGYWYLDLIPNSLMFPDTTRYQFQFRSSSGAIFRRHITVPDSSAWLLTW